ncbi:MAG: efflux RND transporter permease subunit [Dysgonamonadaceae bacterium]|jgi:multidrug efflux pump subunit AcrB|nr:efflux RND transporter permease subunit [Dysgonamonadaceae bacterium]
MKASAFSTILVFVCLSIAGIALIPQLTVKLKPSRDLPHLGVGFSMPGSSPRVVEMEATSKLEAMLSRIKGVRNISSTSRNGGGHIDIDFDKHVDIDAVRFEVSTVVRQTKPFLPDNVGYPYISQTRSSAEASRPFLTYTVNAPATPIVICQYVEKIIKPKIAQIDGVKSVGVGGATPMEWRLEYDHKQLEELHLSPENIRSAITESLNKSLLGMAWTEEHGTREWLRVACRPSESFHDISDFMQLTVANVEGQLIPLGKLVTISYREAEPNSYYRINGLNSVTLEITAEEGANQLELGAAVKACLKAQEALFPPAYEMHLQYDATDYIDEELNKVYFRSGMTMIILLIFVLLIYRSLKYLLLIALSLLMNIAIALIFYYFGRMEIQLYSLAGITISLTLLIDNTIVMSDQIIRRNNLLAFPAILAATLTTIASMVIIFFLNEIVRFNLLDFAKVIMVNLAVSLFVALFLVPALIEKLGIQRKRNKLKRNHFSFFFNRCYAALCRFVWRWKVPICIVIVLTFGLPVFLLPEKINNDKTFETGQDLSLPKRASLLLTETYNKTLGSAVYKEKIKPWTDLCLGGTLRLFAKKVSESRYYSYNDRKDHEETTIFVAGRLPDGSTLEQMDDLVRKMESFISGHREIRLFTTSVMPRSANINIFFTKESARTGFPYMLKNELIWKATQLGGGSWQVNGFGDGFSNDVRENAGQNQINLYGFNYDELWEQAETFKRRLLEHRRIKDVIINSRFSYYKDDYEEFIFKLNPQKIAEGSFRPYDLMGATTSMFHRPVMVGSIRGDYGDEQILLYSQRAKKYDVWSLKYFPFEASAEREFKFGDLADIELVQAPRDIVKENQQYKLCVQYEYIGSYDQGMNVMKNDIEETRKILPMGYSIESQQRYWGWGAEVRHQYPLLFLIFVIIYFMCSILFNSLKQPLLVIFVIPISFIGIFLTFYFFKLRFDEGGFASFILLCGLSINANIYVLNEYNNLRRKRKHLSPLKAYIKAWNAKISPIFLTVVSTVLGFIPFMIGQRESFWYPLAAGTIGGLVMSLVGLFLFLPLFMGVGKQKKDNNSLQN